MVRTAAIITLALSAAPGSASAATVEVDRVFSKTTHQADRIEYRAAASEVNDLEITVDGGSVVVRDRTAIAPGPGCVAEGGGTSRCTVTGGFVATELRVFLGDRADEARVAGAAYAVLRGGPGDDHLTGLTAGANVFYGGAGDDRMAGGSDSDTFRAEVQPDGADTMLGGPGAFDVVDYRARLGGVRADLQGDGDDGAPGERDRIGADVESLGGTEHADVLAGGPGPDSLDGYRGGDVLRGGAGNDELTGDWYVVDRRNEEDQLLGGRGDDTLSGGAGADRLDGGPGRDWNDAGPGRDRLRSRDGAPDGLVCGRGRDRVAPDRGDFVATDCERVTW